MELFGEAFEKWILPMYIYIKSEIPIKLGNFKGCSAIEIIIDN